MADGYKYTPSLLIDGDTLTHKKKTGSVLYSFDQILLSANYNSAYSKITAKLLSAKPNQKRRNVNFIQIND